MTKQRLLADLQTEQDQFEGLLDQIGAARIDRPGVAGHWSVKDIVAHLTGWRRRTVQRLQAARPGEDVPSPLWPSELQTDDAINPWIYEQSRDRSVDAVRADSRQVFDEMVAAIDSFPEIELLDPQRFPWMEGEPLNAAALFGHFHEEHEPDIRAWLAQQASAEQGNGSVLTALFAHNTWANLKLLDYCEQLNDEQLDATAIGGYGSIRATLAYIVGAEVSYVVRVNGKQPPQPFARGQFPGFAALKDIARWAGDELLQLALSARHDTNVQEREQGMVCQYPLASLIVQEVTHATEHRTQIATIITQLGMEPPDMSGWKYMEERGEFKEYAEGAQAAPPLEST